MDIVFRVNLLSVDSSRHCSNRVCVSHGRGTGCCTNCKPTTSGRGVVSRVVFHTHRDYSCGASASSGKVHCIQISYHLSITWYSYRKSNMGCCTLFRRSGIVVNIKRIVRVRFTTAHVGRLIFCRNRHVDTSRANLCVYVSSVGTVSGCSCANWNFTFRRVCVGNAKHNILVVNTNSICTVLESVPTYTHFSVRNVVRKSNVVFGPHISCICSGTVNGCCGQVFPGSGIKIVYLWTNIFCCIRHTAAVFSTYHYRVHARVGFDVVVGKVKVSRVTHCSRHSNTHIISTSYLSGCGVANSGSIYISTSHSATTNS